MTLLDEIPAAFERPVDARPSAVVARIRAIRPSRRAMLRGLVVAATATALVPLDWYLTRRESAARPQRGLDDTSEHMKCAPESYDEEANNWPASGPAVCYGGYRRGAFPCAGGYHREGSYAEGGETFESTRVTSSCQGKNAWRWNGYRCSDAMTTTTFEDGTDYNGLTIAACELPADSPPADSPPADTPPADSLPADSGSAGRGPAGSGSAGGTPSDSGFADNGSAGSGDGGGGPSGSGSRRAETDPATPRRLVPSLGLRSLPVDGA